MDNRDLENLPQWLQELTRNLAAQGQLPTREDEAPPVRQKPTPALQEESSTGAFIAILVVGLIVIAALYFFGVRFIGANPAGL